MRRLPKTEKLLREVGASLVRDKRHLIYRLPNGQNYVVARSSSDDKADIANVTRIRRILRREKTPA